MIQVFAQATQLQLPSGADSVVVQLSAFPPINGAVAVVFDASDSCQLNRTILAHASKLISALPRRYPVWLFSLSGRTPLAALDSYRVEDLQEGRLDFAEFVDKSQLTPQGLQRGSFVRPVLEGIELARSSTGLNDVLVLLLTDGEFFDAAPYPIPSRMDVVGLYDHPDPVKSKHWHRVLPTTPIYTPADQQLDSYFKSQTNPFWGLCEISWHLDQESLSQPIYIDLSEKTSRKLTEAKLECNLSHKSPLLHFEMSAEEFALIRWTCRSMQSREVIRLNVEFRENSVTSELAEMLYNANQSQPGSAPRILLDVNSSSGNFNLIWEDARTAAKLAVHGERWLDKQGSVFLFEGLQLNDEQKKPKYDALLCLTYGDLRSDNSDGSRVLIVALDAKSRPALHWTRDCPLADVHSLNSADVYFDGEHSRWRVQHDSRPAEELDPFGSQLLTGVQVTDPLWTVMFSGSLR